MKITIYGWSTSSTYIASASPQSKLQESEHQISTGALIMHVRGTASEIPGGAAWQRGAPFGGKVRPALGNSLPRGPRLAANAARQLDPGHT